VLGQDGRRHEIWSHEPICRGLRPGEHGPPVIDSLAIAALEVGAFLRRDLGGNEQVQKVPIKV